MRAVKGTFGYLEKKKRNAILWTILCFGISLAVFLAGYLTTGTRKNLLTVVAVLGCLPACKSIVNLITLIGLSPVYRQFERFLEVPELGKLQIEREKGAGPEAKKYQEGTPNYVVDRLNDSF